MLGLTLFSPPPGSAACYRITPPMQKPSAVANGTMRKSMNLKILAPAVAIVLFSSGWLTTSGLAQVPPSASEISEYDGLHAAAHENDTAAIEKALAIGADLESRDSFGRTPVLVAAHASAYDAVRRLVARRRSQGVDHLFKSYCETVKSYVGSFGDFITSGEIPKP